MREQILLLLGALCSPWICCSPLHFLNSVGVGAWEAATSAQSVTGTGAPVLPFGAVPILGDVDGDGGREAEHRSSAVDFLNPRPPAGGVGLRPGFGSAQHSESGVSLCLAGWQESLPEQGRAALMGTVADSAGTGWRR